MSEKRIGFNKIKCDLCDEPLDLKKSEFLNGKRICGSCFEDAQLEKEDEDIARNGYGYMWEE